MLLKLVIFLTFTVFCVKSDYDHGCKQFRQYTRVKRGKFYSNPPLRFYNRPPMTFPVNGPFSYTPPPFMADDEPSYPGSRPFKVSKRPSVHTSDGLGDDDINNIVKHLSKHDLDKLLEFAQGKDESYSKYKDVHNTNEFNQPFKRESRIVYKGNVHKYEEPTPYREHSNLLNYVTEPTFNKVFEQDTRSTKMNAQERPDQRKPFGFVNFSPTQRIPNDIDESRPHTQEYGNDQLFSSFPFPNQENDQTYVFEEQESQSTQAANPGQFRPSNTGTKFQNYPVRQAYADVQGPGKPAVSQNPYYIESNEEEKLPRPVNMREEDIEVSYTNNVHQVVKSDSNSYEVENFGDLPLMDYHSKLHDVSSYHVPHYTVTQPRPSNAVSYQPSHISSTLLKPSPAAAAIKEPVYERAPPASSAADQSDAHLKAIKIWSHKSQGAAYTLHDDGSLTPERSRPKYG